MDGTNDSRTQEGPGVLSRGTVLIVDENRADLHCYRFILRMLGYEVLTCGTYDEGIAHLDTGGFDLVIVSQGTADFEGRRVLERAVQLDLRLPVLVISRNLNMPCYLEAMKLGAADYLAEPITAQELAGAVQTHLWTRPTHPNAVSADERGKGPKLLKCVPR